MREIIENPILPILTKIREDKKTFRLEFMQFVILVSISLFVLVFVPVFSFLLAVHSFNG